MLGECLMYTCEHSASSNPVAVMRTYAIYFLYITIDDGGAGGSGWRRRVAWKPGLCTRHALQNSNRRILDIQKF